jgi:hypothetical protein
MNKAKPTKSKSYEDLPIYKEIYDTNVYLVAAVRNAPRNYRTHVEDLIHSTLKVSELCYRASTTTSNKNPEKKLRLISELLDEVSVVLFKAKLLGEPSVRVLSIKQYARISKGLHDIREQASKWLKSTERRLGQSVY